MQVVLQRELQAHSRRWITYWSRVLAVVLGIIVILQSSLLANSGTQLFYGTFALGSILCILDSIRRSSGAIADEIESGTVGLLLLTPLSGVELFLGKYASVMIGSASTALAILPLFAISFLLGGVSLGEFILASVVLVHFVSISTVIGIFISAQNRSSLAAAFGTIGFLLGGCFISGLFLAAPPLAFMNPLSPLLWIADTRATPWPAYAISIIISQSMAWLLLRVHARKFPLEWCHAEERQLRYAPYYKRPPYRAEETPPSTHDKGSETPTYDIWGTPKWFKGDPFEWLTLRDVSMHKEPWLVSVIAAALAIWTALAYPSTLFIAAFFALGMVAFLCVAASRPIAQARHSNLIELAMTTPLGAKGIIAGHLRALRRIFLIPCIITSVICFSVAYSQGSFPLRSAFWNYYLAAGVVALFIATPWIGLWMGILCKSPTRAVFATLALVIFLPGLGGCVMINLVYFTILGFVAHRQVMRNFSRIIGARYSS